MKREEFDEDKPAFVKFEGKKRVEFAPSELGGGREEGTVDAKKFSRNSQMFD